MTSLTFMIEMETGGEVCLRCINNMRDFKHVLKTSYTCHLQESKEREGGEAYEVLVVRFD